MFSSRQLFFAFQSPEKNSTAIVEEQGGEDYAEDDEQYDDNGDNYDGEQGEQSEQGGANQLAANQALVTLSYSLMNQIRQTARMEGVGISDIIIELLSEGVTRRAFEDASRPTPSHLMTRTGYVPPDVNGNVAQPSMSHHSYNNNNNNQRRGQQNNQRRNNNNQGNYRNNNNNNGGGFNRYGKKGGGNQQHHRNNNGYSNQQQGYRDNQGNGGGNYQQQQPQQQQQSQAQSNDVPGNPKDEKK